MALFKDSEQQIPCASNGHGAINHYTNGWKIMEWAEEARDANDFELSLDRTCARHLRE
jgi:hypothetical protein